MLVRLSRGKKGSARASIYIGKQCSAYETRFSSCLKNAYQNPAGAFLKICETKPVHILTKMNFFALGSPPSIFFRVTVIWMFSPGTEYNHNAEGLGNGRKSSHLPSPYTNTVIFTVLFKILSGLHFLFYKIIITNVCNTEIEWLFILNQILFHWNLFLRLGIKRIYTLILIWKISI